MKLRHGALMNNANHSTSSRTLPRFSFKAVLVASCLLLPTDTIPFKYHLPGTHDVYIQGNELAIVSPMSGRVVFVDSNHADFVNKGDVLVRMDNTQALARYQLASNKIINLLQKTKDRFVSDETHHSYMVKAQMRYQQALSEYHHSMQSQNTSVISKKMLQQSLAAVSSSKVVLDGAIKQYRQNQQHTQAADLAERRIMRKVTAEFQDASLALDRTEVRSPSTGYVVQRYVRPGENVSSGALLVAIVPAEQIWLSASFKITQLTGILMGQKVSVITDLYGSQVVLEGKVDGLNLDLSALSYLNGENNWNRTIPRVFVRIALNPLQMRRYPLRPGIASTVTLLADTSSGQQQDAPEA